MTDKKQYMKRYMRSYINTPKGFLTKQYCRFRERGLCNISKKSFISWSLKNKSFQKLFQKWIDSNNNKWLKPSVDRINEYKPYQLDNIKWVTWKQNQIKMRTEKKNVLAYTKNFSKEREKRQYYLIVQKKSFFMIFKNLNEVINTFPFMNKSHISQCINKKRKTHHNFRFFKYPEVVAR